MKQVLSSQCAIVVLLLAFGAFSSVLAQSPTPDPFVSQITSSPIGGLGNPFLSAASDITANGRFVVFESNGNVATFNPDNADGNREIFLLDYAQRRIFQITHTKNVPRPAPSPTPTPTPSASPTPTPLPTPADPATIQIEINNVRPMISFEPQLSGGVRVYTIVFSSNAPTPASFDGGTTSPGDANQEIWIYQLPAVADAALNSGDDLPLVDLSAGTFSRITNTAASRTIRTAQIPTDIVDDNREATISDNGDIIAFISTRSLIGTGNADGNPDLFLATRTAANWSSFNLVQGTTTQDATPGVGRIFQQNPSLSADGSRVIFVSTANLAANNTDNNSEIFIATFSGTGLSAITQVTRTRTDNSLPNGAVNVLSPGRRLSRDGALIAFESLAEDPKANTTATNTQFLAAFVYTVATDTFTRVGLRATGAPGDIAHFPTFTDYTGLTPASLLFASALNFKTDGTFPAADQASTGLNVNNQPQIFTASLPIGSGTTFTRLTRNPVGTFLCVSGSNCIRAVPSQTRNRVAFSIGGYELGGGNTDGSIEVFYLLVPNISSENAAALSFFTGASNFPVATATPSPSPAASPTPTPALGTIAAGIAAGELTIVRSTVGLAPGDKNGAGGPEAERSPILPVELNGVSVAIDGAAAGLYFVGDDPAEGIRFVAPVGLTVGAKSVVINNNGTVYRGTVQINQAAPDIFTSTNDAGGVAVICNVTNTASPGCTMGPFPLNSSNGTANVPTVLELWLTGVRGITPAETRVRIGTTEITPSSVRRNTNMFGFDLITFTLPATITPGTYPVIVTVTKTGTFQSRAEATAATITIIP